MTIKVRLFISLICIGVIPLVCAAVFIGYTTQNQLHDALEQKAAEKLVAVREMKRDQLLSHFRELERVLQNLAITPVTLAAMADLGKSFDLSKTPDEAQITELEQFYSGAFSERLQQGDPERSSADINAVLAHSDAPAHFYQARYISGNPHPLDSKAEFVQAEKLEKFVARYDLYHREHHATLRQVQQRFGFADLLLVDPDGRVVYSVAKHVDFATSLKGGPFSDTALADAWQQTAASEAGQVFMSDFGTYLPAYGAAVAFLSTPILKDGDRIGTLIAQLPVTEIDGVLSSYRQWSQVGLGKTGEVYLVGSDRRLRSESRKLLEQAPDLLEQMQRTGWQDRLDSIRVRNSGIALQRIDSEAVTQALQGNSGVQQGLGYYAEPVISAYAPIDLMGQHWALISEIGAREAFDDVDRIVGSMRTTSAIVVSLVLVVAILAGLFVTRLLVTPIRHLVGALEQIAEGEGDLSVQLASAVRRDEIGELSRAFNTFVANIRALVVDVAATARELGGLSRELQTDTGTAAENMSSQHEKTRSIAGAMTQFAASIDEVARSSQDTLESMLKVDRLTQSGMARGTGSVEQIDQLVTETQDTAQAIIRLSGEIDQISTVLDTINGIAGQTSLLALNAAIEAARAGEMGRGFAVVADEVRTLSARTQSATVEIEQMIERLRNAAQSSVQRVESAEDKGARGIELVSKTVEELCGIGELVNDARQMHERITAAVTQQQSAVKVMEHEVLEVDQLSNTTHDATRQIAGRAVRLQAMAQRLDQLVGRFRTGKQQ